MKVLTIMAYPRKGYGIIVMEIIQLTYLKTYLLIKKRVTQYRINDFTTLKLEKGKIAINIKYKELHSI